MKNKFLTALFVCLFAAFGLSAQSYYSRTLVTLDTITNTEADTARTSLSGTANTTMVLQESNVSTGGAATWYTVATASGTGATVTTISAANLYGRRHRLILTGTGTQSTSYGITATLKKVN